MARSRSATSPKASAGGGRPSRGRPARLDEAGGAQALEVMADERLGQPDVGDELGDARLAVGQAADDAQAIDVGEGLVERAQLAQLFGLEDDRRDGRTERAGVGTGRSGSGDSRRINARLISTGVDATGGGDSVSRARIAVVTRPRRRDPGRPAIDRPAAATDIDARRGLERLGRSVRPASASMLEAIHVDHQGRRAGSSTSRRSPSPTHARSSSAGSGILRAIGAASAPVGRAYADIDGPSSAATSRHDRRPSTRAERSSASAARRARGIERRSATGA